MGGCQPGGACRPLGPSRDGLEAGCSAIGARAEAMAHGSSWAALARSMPHAQWLEYFDPKAGWEGRLDSRWIMRIKTKGQSRGPANARDEGLSEREGRLVAMQRQALAEGFEGLLRSLKEESLPWMDKGKLAQQRDKMRMRTVSSLMA